MSEAVGEKIAPGVVAVVGACGFLGGHLVAKLAAEPGVDGVVALDAVTPTAELRRRMRDAEFVRIDPQNPLMSKVIAQRDVRTVIHVGVSSRVKGMGRAAVKERNVLGSLQVVAACRNTESVRRVIFKSSTCVYGSSSSDPAMFTEQRPTQRHAGGVAQDLLDVEGYLRGLRRLRPEVDVTVLRMADVVGRWSSSSLGAVLRLPIAPTVMGFDPRIQLLHEDDALAVLVHTALAGPAGTFNVAGDGIVPLSAMIARAGHIPLPIPGFLYPSVAKPLTGSVHLGTSDTDFMRFGRCVDTTAMREVLGFEPRWTTAEALEYVLEHLGSPRPVTRERIERVGGVVERAVRFVTGGGDR